MKFCKVNYKIFLVTVSIILTSAIYVVIAAPPSSEYTPGETLAPNCAPGSTNCTVTSPITGNETITLSGDASGSGTTSIAMTIASDSIEESMLKAVDTANDEECLTYETTTGDFEWQTCSSASGDVTDVGDCTGGACFDGSSDGGTYLRLYDGDSNYTALVSGNVSGNISIILPTTAGTLALDGCTDCFNATEIEDIYLLNSGDSGTGVYDFGGATSLEIVNGADVTPGTTGQVAIDTTSDQLKYYGGSALQVIAPFYEKCFTLESPADADDNVPLWSPNKAITITDMYCRVQGGTSAVITLSDGTNALDSLTCDTSGVADDGSIANNTFTANEKVEFDTGTVTGTVTWVNYCFTYTITAD